MDVFEQWLNMSWEKNAKERKQITNEKRSVCICPVCPSYNRCARENNELLYCIAGKSMLCISEDDGLYLQEMSGYRRNSVLFIMISV